MSSSEKLFRDRRFPAGLLRGFKKQSDPIVRQYPGRFNQRRAFVDILGNVFASNIPNLLAIVLTFLNLHYTFLRVRKWFFGLDTSDKIQVVVATLIAMTLCQLLFGALIPLVMLGLLVILFSAHRE